MKQTPQGTFNGIVVDLQGRVPGYYHYVIPRGEKTHMQTTDLPAPAPHLCFWSRLFHPCRRKPNRSTARPLGEHRPLNIYLHRTSFLYTRVKSFRRRRRFSSSPNHTFPGIAYKEIESASAICSPTPTSYIKTKLLAWEEINWN